MSINKNVSVENTQTEHLICVTKITCIIFDSYYYFLKLLTYKSIDNEQYLLHNK